MDGGGDGGEVLAEVRDRVITHVEAEEFLLPLQLLLFGSPNQGHFLNSAKPDVLRQEFALNSLQPVLVFHLK